MQTAQDLGEGDALEGRAMGQVDEKEEREVEGERLLSRHVFLHVFLHAPTRLSCPSAPTALPSSEIWAYMAYIKAYMMSHGGPLFTHLDSRKS